MAASVKTTEKSFIRGFLYSTEVCAAGVVPTGRVCSAVMVGWEREVKMAAEVGIVSRWKLERVEKKRKVHRN
jgi:hypothetical protein